MPNHHPDDQNHGWRLIRELIWVMALLITSIGCFGPAVLREKLISVYEDFNSDLPTLTTWLLSIPSWLIFGLGFMLVAVLFAKRLLVRNHPLSTSIDMTIAFFILAWGLAFCVAIWLPFFKIMHSVQ